MIKLKPSEFKKRVEEQIRLNQALSDEEKEELITLFNYRIDAFMIWHRKGCSDFLIGVGQSYYLTEAEFLEEVFRLGVSKRIPVIPKDLCFGKSKIYLVHWGSKKIFAYFIPKLLVAVDSEETKRKLLYIKNVAETILGQELHIDIKTTQEIAQMESALGGRHCGVQRGGGGRYAISKT